MHCMPLWAHPAAVSSSLPTSCWCQRSACLCSIHAATQVAALDTLYAPGWVGHPSVGIRIPVLPLLAALLVHLVRVWSMQQRMQSEVNTVKVD
jgi:hypothetical protein